MFLEIEESPNFEGSFFVRFQEVGPPRPVTHIKSYDRSPQGEWLAVTGWCDDPEHPLCPAYAQMVADSGSGIAYLVYGGNWGIRLKPENDRKEWSLQENNQRGEGYLSLGEERDLRYK